MIFIIISGSIFVKSEISNIDIDNSNPNSDSLAKFETPTDNYSGNP